MQFLSREQWYDGSRDKEYVMKIYTGKKGSYERLVGFFTLHHQIRKQKKVKEQLLFPKEEIQLAKKRKDSLTEIKFMKLDNEAEWGIWKDIFYIHYYPINKKPYGFLIKDLVFAQTFNQVFNQLWEKAKNNETFK